MKTCEKHDFARKNQENLPKTMNIQGFGKFCWFFLATRLFFSWFFDFEERKSSKTLGNHEKIIKKSSFC